MARVNLEKLTRRIEKLGRAGIVPSAILLSGGGNDVAGDEFRLLLNHAASPIAGLNQSIVQGVIYEQSKGAYITIISTVTSLCQDRLGRVLPIIVHGYDYAIPDGRGFAGGWGPFPGPWLEPGFREKGFDELQQRIAIVRSLIDRFNTMLNDLPLLSGFDHVHYLDLRGTLSGGPDYREDWANELHPSSQGFAKVTELFARKLEEVTV